MPLVMVWPRSLVAAAAAGVVGYPLSAAVAVTVESGFLDAAQPVDSATKKHGMTIGFRIETSRGAPRCLLAGVPPPGRPTFKKRRSLVRVGTISVKVTVRSGGMVGGRNGVS